MCRDHYWSQIGKILKTHKPAIANKYCTYLARGDEQLQIIKSNMKPYTSLWFGCESNKKIYIGVWLQKEKKITWNEANCAYKCKVNKIKYF